METSPATNHLHAWSGESLFLPVVAEGALIARHYEIYRWLNGELQQFLPHDRQRFVSLADALIAQIDGAFRKVAVLPLRSAPASPAAASVLDLSEREREILESLREGKTNVDIALALDISPFTVKNHVQRIFRKIGVSNRTQAAARYGDAVREAALRLTGQPGIAA